MVVIAGIAGILTHYLYGSIRLMERGVFTSRAAQIHIAVTGAVFLVLLGSAAKPIMVGHFAPLFWGGLVAFGLVVPLILDLVGHRMKPLAAVSAILVLIGGFVLRYVIVMSIQG